MRVYWNNTMVEAFLLLVVAIVSQGNAREVQENRTGWGHYHQNDYDVVMEIVYLVEYNHKYMRDVRGGLIFLNRTQKGINGSGHLLTDLTEDMHIEVATYRMASNEYRFFPITFNVNPCNEYQHNNFNVRGILSRVSNLRECPPKKGFYYVNRFVPDFSKGPPYMIRGKFKIVVKGYWKSEFMGEVNVFGSIKDKPLKWD